VNAVRVPWSGASFLAYLGGFVVLFAILTLLGEQGAEHGSGRLTFLALLLFALLAAASGAAARTGHRVSAGLLALSTVAASVIFAGALLSWIGWLAHFGAPLAGFHVSFLALELVAIAAASVAWGALRFPPLVFVGAIASWYFTADLLSNGGDWTATVTIVFGLILLMAAVAADPVPAFWLHLAAGLTLGGAILWFFHDADSTFDWIVIAAAGLAFIRFGAGLARSTWVVLGAFGVLQSAFYFSDRATGVDEFSFPGFPFAPFVGLYSEGEQDDLHAWAGPLVIGVTGLVFMAIAVLLASRRRGAGEAAQPI
jgi:hypothetical protein